MPTDFSETSDTALAYAKTFAARIGASVHLLHVFADPYAAAGCAPEVYAPLPPDVRAHERLAAEAYMTEAPPMRTAMLDHARSRMRQRARGCSTTEAIFGRAALTTSSTRTSSKSI